MGGTQLAEQPAAPPQRCGGAHRSSPQIHPITAACELQIYETCVAWIVWFCRIILDHSRRNDGIQPRVVSIPTPFIVFVFAILIMWAFLHWKGSRSDVVWILVRFTFCLCEEIEVILFFFFFFYSDIVWKKAWMHMFVRFNWSYWRFWMLKGFLLWWCALSVEKMAKRILKINSSLLHCEWSKCYVTWSWTMFVLEYYYYYLEDGLSIII